MTYVLDTDHLSILQEETGPEFERLTGRLSLINMNDVVTTVVSFQEQTQGWLTLIGRAKKVRQILQGYAELLDTIEDFSDLQVLAFDQVAQDKFEELAKQRVRVGTLDLRIAAIALVNDAMVLTRNLRDFGKVPGLRAEDWTA